MPEEIVVATAVPEVTTPPAPAKKKKKDFSDEERKKYERDVKSKNRKKDKAEASKVSRKYFSTLEIKKDAALEILEKERKIRHPRVLEVLWKLAETAARNLSIPVNAHLFTHGAQGTLEAAKTKQEQPLPEIQDVWSPGERVREHELRALYDFSTSWRVQPDGSSLTFDKWRELRRVCITDVFRFGNEVLGMDFHEQPHGRWTRDLFVRKNPDLLPENYNWEDVKKAIAGQSDIHQRLLMSSRSSYKSSYNLIDLLSWVLCFGGDIRILMVSATQPLSRGFLKKFKNYWTVKNPNNPNLFNQLYPEFMLYVGEEGSEKNFVSPMRQLDLIQPTLVSSSLTSEGLAGERCDLLVAEDCAEISNSNSEEMREKTLMNFDMLRELLEPFGFLQMVGTPFAPGDIYSVLLDREDKRDEKKMLVQINPCWWVKPEVRKTPYDVTLTEDEVILMFPSRLGFKYLKDKLKESVNIFRQQSLCEWVPDADDSLKCQFEEHVLRQHVRLPGFFDNNPQYQLIETVQGVDVASSVARYADFSAIATAKIYLDRKSNKYNFVVVDMVMERLRHSELGVKIVEQKLKWSPARMLVEQGGYREALSQEINKACVQRSLPIIYSIYWMPTQGLNIKNKVARVKSLEGLLASDQLWFVHGTWTESLIQQFIRFDGVKKSGSSDNSKDDGPDVLGAIWSAYGPREFGEVKPQAQTEAEDAAQVQAFLRGQHEMYFGGGNPAQPQPLPPPDITDSGGLLGTLSRFGLVK